MVLAGIVLCGYSMRNSGLLNDEPTTISWLLMPIYILNLPIIWVYTKSVNYKHVPE